MRIYKVVGIENGIRAVTSDGKYGYEPGSHLFWALNSTYAAPFWINLGMFKED